MYYWSKLYAGEIYEGDDYKSLNKTIVILISDFELDVTKTIPKIHTKWEIREEEYSKIVLTNVLEIHIIEIPKLIKALENKKVDKKDKLILWTLFMLSPWKLGDEEMENNEDIKKAKEELEKINQDEREKELARLRLKHIMDTKAIQDYGYEEGMRMGMEDGIKEGIKEGIEKGIEKGKKEGKLEDAKKMLQLDIPIEKVIEITGLSKEEIQENRLD